MQKNLTMLEEDYYRGESKDYGETSCTPSILRTINQGDNLLNEECKYYNSVYDVMAEHATIKQINENAPYIKHYHYLSVFQHYGFATRLLDITTKVDIAKYFACCSDFNDDGFIYKIEKIKEYKNIAIEHVSRKMELVFDVNHNVTDIEVGSILNKNEKSPTISDNVIVDNKKLKLKFINLRQERQAGKFVLFGNRIDKKIILRAFQELQKEIYEQIDKNKKFEELIKLSKTGINYVSLFPDDSLSIKIQALYIKFANNRITKNDLSFLTKNDPLKERLESLFRDYQANFKDNKNCFYFILKEMLDYVAQTNQKNIEKIINQVLNS